MLGRKFLKRFTRLGLSAYLMTWCMSFTVCASDYPISDLTTENLTVEAAEASSLVDDEEITEQDTDAPDADVTGEDDVEIGDLDENVTGEAGNSTEGIATPGDPDVPVPAPVPEPDPEPAPAPEPVPVPANESTDLNTTYIDDLLERLNSTASDKTVESISFYEPEVVVYDNTKTVDLWVNAEVLPGKELDRINFDKKFFDENMQEITKLENLSVSEYGIGAGRPYFDIDISKLKESTTFYFGISYRNDVRTGFGSENNPVAYCKITYIKPDTYKAVTGFTMDVHDVVVTNNTKPLIINVTDYTPSEAVFNFSRINITVYDEMMSPLETDSVDSQISFVRDDHGYPCGLNLSKLDKSMILYVKYTYRNRVAKEALNPTDICRVQYIAPDVFGKTKIDLSKTSADINIYKKQNIIPINIVGNIEDSDEKLTGAGSGALYTIYGVRFCETEVRDMFNVTILDGDKISIRLSDYFLSSHKTVAEVNSAVASKYVSKLEVILRNADRSMYSFTSDESLTLNIKKTVPKVEASKLTINPWLCNMTDVGYGAFVPKFTGADVTSFDIDSSKTAPAGFYVKGGKVLQTTVDVNTKVKSGKIPVIATLDEDVWNLPNGNRIAATIPYAIKASTPKIKIVGATKASLNPSLGEGNTGDMAYINFSITNDPAGDTKATEWATEIVDSKGKNASDAFGYESSFSSAEGVVTAGFYIQNMSAVKKGATYKVKIFPVNRRNRKKGAATEFSLTILKDKDAGKISMTVGTKGSINPYDPDSYMTVTANVKNIGYINIGESELHITDSKKNDVTKYFQFEYLSTNKLKFKENTVYDILRNKLDGDKLTFNLTCPYGSEGKTLSAVKTVMIKCPTVTTKLNVTKASINPASPLDRSMGIKYDLPGVKCDLPVVVSIKCGKQVILENYESAQSGSGKYIFDLWDIAEATGKSNITAFYGKTLELKFTPFWDKDFSNRTIKVKPATCKITVMNPAKKKLGVSTKVKGTLDNIHANSSVLVTNRLSNAYCSGYDYLYADGYYIYQKSGKTVKDCNRSFRISEEYEGLRIYRVPGVDVAPGTYYLNFTVKSYVNDIKVPVTVSFKVKRGKISHKSSKSTLELISNSSKRDTFTITNKLATGTEVKNVTVADKKSPFNVIALGGGKYSLGYKDGKYVELKKKKPITAPVTKTVKLNVYNDGSTTPTTLKIKVKIYP